MTTQEEVMIRTICATDNSTATTMLRLVLGVVFFAHGAQKMLGWFGGFGFSATMALFTGTMYIPAPLALVAIVAKFFGGLGLILGCLTRIAAFGIRDEHAGRDCNRPWRLRIVHELDRLAAR
jgi:putative oxidoreductase